MAILQLLTGEVGVRDAERVERRAPPALVLRAGPAVDVADARYVEVVRLDSTARWRRRDRPRRQAEILQHRLELRAIRIGDDDRPGAEIMTRHLEVVFGRRH